MKRLLALILFGFALGTVLKLTGLTDHRATSAAPKEQVQYVTCPYSTSKPMTHAGQRMAP